MRRPVLLVAALLTAGARAHAQYQAYAVTSGAGGAQQLLRFDTGNPNGAAAVGATGANLVALSFRPATGTLYGFDGAALFTVDLGTGAATRVATVGPNPLSPVGPFAFSFNPTVDRIRLFGPGGNLRVNPDNGAAVVDGPWTFAPGDPNTGAAAPAAVAYTNSDRDPATGTTLYGITPGAGALLRIDAPNGGFVSTVGALLPPSPGLAPAPVAFDIVTDGRANVGFFAAATRGGVSNLYRVDLATAAFSPVGSVGGGAIQALAIAAVPEPGTWALLGLGLVGVGSVAARRRGRVGA